MRADFTDWYALKREEIENRRAGGCDCCIGIREGRHPARPVGRRAWWWTTNSGAVVGLCDRCCAGWLENARQDPDLAPKKLEKTESLG